MASFQEIQYRLYNLKLGLPINESVDIYDIHKMLNTNKDDFLTAIKHVTSNQINEYNLLESVCENIMKYDFDDKDKKIISNALLGDILYIPNIREYKDNLLEVADNLNNQYLKESIENIIQCDRIIKNNKLLNEYSDFKSIFSNYYAIHDMESIVLEACETINSYELDNDLKMTIALENIVYNMDLTKQEYDKRELVDLIYEYFCIIDKPNTKILSEVSINLPKNDINYIIEGKDDTSVGEKFKSLFRKGVDTNSFTSLFKSIYKQPASNIVSELPNIIKWIRIMVVAAIAGFNLPLGLIIGLANHLIEVKVNRVEIEKTIKTYKKEKEKIENKRYSVTNPNTSKKYEKLSREYDDAISKLEAYRDTLYSDKENEERIENESYEDIYKVEATFDVIYNTIKEFCNHNKKINEMIYEYISEINNINDKDVLFESISNSKLIPNNIVNLNEVSIKDPLIIGSMASDIVKMRKKDTSLENMTLYDYVDEMYYYNQVYNALNESTFGAKVKMMTINAKNKLRDLSDKDRMISRQIDATFNRMKDKIDEDKTRQNREAVIRGSIIPSFSSLIKLATGSGVLALAIHPVLGAITFLGGLAMSKLSTEKEKKYIVDEIDIQLQVIEKKISIAEGNNDMKTYEQLLRIQKQLKDQKQRILYQKNPGIYVIKNKD